MDENLDAAPSAKDADAETGDETRRPAKRRREPIVPRLVTVVQSVHVGWSKKARGGKEATLRNAVPEVVRLPLHLCSSLANVSLLHHQRGYDGLRGISSAHDKVTLLTNRDALTIGCVTIESDAQEIYATYQYTEACGGAPHRDDFRRRLRLTEGQWGQILYNGRFVDQDSLWFYEKIVVNVGLFNASTIVPSLFTQNEPEERLSVMALLI